MTTPQELLELEKAKLKKVAKAEKEIEKMADEIVEEINVSKKRGPCIDSPKTYEALYAIASLYVIRSHKDELLKRIKELEDAINEDKEERK